MVIKMIKELEDMKYGTPHLCDFQKANFGFVEVNGQLDFITPCLYASLFMLTAYTARFFRETVQHTTKNL